VARRDYSHHHHLARRTGARSLTLDQGAEMAQHDRLNIDSGGAFTSAIRKVHGQRGPNEKHNGLLRQYFPKGTDLSVHSAD